MAKKIFAVTNVKIGNGEGEFFAAGTEIDHTKFSKDQLKELNAAGAIEVRTVDEVSPDPVTEQTDDSGSNPEDGKGPAENE